jgi:polyisoprenyl-phosphate glycosyltransferase
LQAITGSSTLNDLSLSQPAFAALLDAPAAAASAPPPFISVVSPVYMAQRILPALCQRLDAALSQLTPDYEIILVCDGSPDNSWRVMQDLVHQHPRLVAVNLSRNFGQHYATTAGMDLARGTWTVVMDCDLQDPPEEIAQLLERAQEGFDIVVARRMNRKHSWIKRTSSALFHRVFGALSGMRLDPTVGSFRIMSRSVVDGFCGMRESYRMFAGLIEWLGFRTGFVDVQHADRFEGRTSYNLRRLLRMALDGMISFSNRPLYISIGMGLVLSLVSALYGGFLILRYLLNPDMVTVPGWLSTVTVTTFLGGLILLNQGVLGIYLGRLYNQAKGRPLYVVDKVLVGSASRGGAAERSTSIGNEGRPHG